MRHEWIVLSLCSQVFVISAALGHAIGRKLPGDTPKLTRFILHLSLLLAQVFGVLFTRDFGIEVRRDTVFYLFLSEGFIFYVCC